MKSRKTAPQEQVVPTVLALGAGLGSGWLVMVVDGSFWVAASVAPAVALGMLIWIW